MGRKNSVRHPGKDLQAHMIVPNELNFAEVREKIKLLQDQGVLELANGWEEVSLNPHKEARSGSFNFSRHNPVWAYVNPKFANPYSTSVNNKPLFEIFNNNIQIDAIIQKTQYVVIIGCRNTQDFYQLINLKGVIKLVFEPNINYFCEFMAQCSVDSLLQQNIFFIVGDIARLDHFLSEVIDPAINNLGFPIFFIQGRLRKYYDDYIDHLIETIEILYYRHRIYPIEGQENQRGLPLRNIKRELFFDQQKHFYENIINYLTCGNLQQLNNILTGATAILVGAGPDLDNKIEYIRQNMDRAVVISVNNALKTLLKNGIEPHFVVINDTSLSAGKSFEGLQRLNQAILVSHCLSATGGIIFRRKFFFGNWRSDLFGSRPNLRLHGSVITTAFSLARFLGCQCCVLIGVMLASRNSRHFSYSKDSIHGCNDKKINAELINRYPQLYPVKAASGETLYSTLNFRDVSMWFIDEIRRHDIDVINTTNETILYADKITIRDDYKIPNNGNIRSIINNIIVNRNNIDNRLIESYIKSEIDFWKNVRMICRQCLENAHEGKSNEEIMNYFDDNNVTYLMQRYSDFDYKQFSDYFYDAISNQSKGILYYVDYADKMAAYFEKLLMSQLNQMRMSLISSFKP